MRNNFYFVINLMLKFFFFFACWFNIGFAKANLPKIKHSDRHISFQAGKVGDKPWDPDASSTVLINFASAVYTKPIYVDSSFNLKPGFFKSWKWDFKTNSFTLEIDGSLKFDEARALKVIDVEYAFVKNFLSEFGFYARASLEEIIGIQELIGHKKFKSGMCPGIKIISDTQLQIFLKSGNPHFIYSLQDSLPFVAPIEDFKEDHFSFKEIPRGTGPYKVVWSDPNSSLVRLEKKIISNEDLRGQFPLTIDFLNEGTPKDNKPDLSTGAGSSGINSLKAWKIEYGSVPDAHYTLDFNYTMPLAQNKNFRKAIFHALDRKDLIKKYATDRVSYELVPSKYMGRAGLKNPQDLELAKKIVDSQLRHFFRNKKSIKGIFHGHPGKIKPLPKKLMEQLSAVGIKANIDGRRVLRQFGEDKDAVFKINGVEISYTDPLSCFSRFIPSKKFKNLIAPPAAQNLVQLYIKAKKAATKEKRAKYIVELTKAFNKGYYAIPISESYPRFAYGPRIESIGIEGIFAAVDFLKVKIKKKSEK